MGYRLMLAMLIAVQMSGCSIWPVGAPVHLSSEFRYVQRDEVRATMRQLAVHSRQLDDLMLQDEAPLKHRGEIIEHLRAMESAAVKLEQSGFSTNHPKIDTNLPTFRSDLKLAREAIEREPPNFLLAALVRGACDSCHGSK